MLGCVAALCGGLAVGFGAFGAHGLKHRLSIEAMAWWDTATLYLLLHAVAALAIALSGRGGIIQAGGWCFIAGGVVFAGTLYAMALGAPRILGAVTPLGGLAMIIGWWVLAWSFLRTSPW